MPRSDALQAREAFGADRLRPSLIPLFPKSKSPFPAFSSLVRDLKGCKIHSQSKQILILLWWASRLPKSRLVAIEKCHLSDFYL